MWRNLHTFLMLSGELIKFKWPSHNIWTVFNWNVKLWPLLYFCENLKCKSLNERNISFTSTQYTAHKQFFLTLKPSLLPCHLFFQNFLKCVMYVPEFGGFTSSTCSTYRHPFWWKKCSTGQSCIFPKWLFIKSIFKYYIVGLGMYLQFT